MMAFPSMLISPAKDAGIKCPNLDVTNEWDTEQFPHFTVFCNLQLGRPMKMDGEQWRNAKIIATFTEEQIKVATLNDFLAAGLEWQQ